MYIHYTGYNVGHYIKQYLKPPTCLHVFSPSIQALLFLRKQLPKHQLFHRPGGAAVLQWPAWQESQDLRDFQPPQVLWKTTCYVIPPPLHKLPSSILKTASRMPLLLREGCCRLLCLCCLGTIFSNFHQTRFILGEFIPICSHTLSWRSSFYPPVLFDSFLWGATFHALF